MRRRNFLSGAAGAAAAGFAAPAIAQSSPQLRWRMTSSFPKSLDTIYGGCEMVAKYVGDLTDGQFQISSFAGNEIVPPLQAIDAVQSGTIEMAHTTSFYNIGKDLAWVIGSALPFGLNPRLQNAWMYHGGGNELLDQFYADNGLVAFPAGNSGAQMGGWFRREVKGLNDLKGLKFRVSGITGQILTKVGVVPQTLSGGDTFAALERGTIDAAEWIGPYDDEKLGFVKIAPYYYYPGWWEGGVVIHTFVNRAKWETLPTAYKNAVRIASQAANVDMLAKYDARNPAAIRRLVASGAQLRAFPQEVIQACFAAAKDVYSELAAKNETFKKLHDSLWAFRKDANLWWQVAEYTNDGINISTRDR